MARSSVQEYLAAIDISEENKMSKVRISFVPYIERIQSATATTMQIQEPGKSRHPGSKNRRKKRKTNRCLEIK